MSQFKEKLKMGPFKIPAKEGAYAIYSTLLLLDGVEFTVSSTTKARLTVVLKHYFPDIKIDKKRIKKTYLFERKPIKRKTFGLGRKK